MADILIKGMELPKEGNVYLIIGEDGVVSEKIGSMYHVTTEAIELPPHGKLCEKEAVWDMLHGICVKCNENKDNEKHISCIWCKIKDAYGAVFGGIPTFLEVSHE